MQEEEPEYAGAAPQIKPPTRDGEKRARAAAGSAAQETAGQKTKAIHLMRRMPAWRARDATAGPDRAPLPHA